MDEILAENVDQHYRVVAAPCLITKQLDRCIQVKLGTIVVPADPDKEGAEPRIVEVYGKFSREGLERLQRDLASVPDPIGIPSQQQVNNQTPYQWAVVMEDGEHYQQYPVEGGELPFGAIHLPNVCQFWIIPRVSADALPWYGLVRGEGWKIRETDGTTRSLDLTHPGEEPFEWHYLRNISLTFALQGEQADSLPPHIVQILGWRVENTIFEIGIEYDGSWQIWRRQPDNDPRWNTVKG